jgi:hypothetical protein
VLHFSELEWKLGEEKLSPLESIIGQHSLPGEMVEQLHLRGPVRASSPAIRAILRGKVQFLHPADS